MRKSDLLKVFIIGGIVGAILFLLIYGPGVLDVTYDAWLLQGGDLTQHYLGWEFYRKSDWHFPIGLIDGLAYPYKASIIFTDSIPVFAVLFKLLSPMLPTTFQYWGIWGIICYILQGGFAAVLLSKYIHRKYLCVIGAVFFCLAPIMVQRLYGHEALAGHWLILAAMSIWAYRDKIRSFKKGIICWGTISGLASLTHIYILAICMGIFWGYIIDDYLYTKQYKKLGALFIADCVIVFSILFCFGAFYGNVAMSSGGLGYYSANINTLFNSAGQGLIGGTYPLATSGQYEGYGYLGFGIILLFIISLILMVIYKRNLIKKYKIHFIVILIFFVLSLSPTITFNNKILIELKIPSLIVKILSIFRCSGRFIWPVVYFVMLFAIVTICNINKRYINGLVMIVCLVIQIADLRGFLISKTSYKTAVNETLQSLFTPLEQFLPKQYKHIAVMDIRNVTLDELIEIAIYANDNNMTTNAFYFARSINDLINKQIKVFNNELLEGFPREDTIYIFPESYKLWKNFNLHYYKVNNKIIGIKNRIEGLEEEVVLYPKEISIPLRADNLINGRIEDEEVILNKNGCLYGPYMSIPKGNYRLEIKGRFLDEAVFDVSYDEGTQQIQMQKGYNDKICQEYRFQVLENIMDIEFRSFNFGDEDVGISSIILYCE